MGQSIRVINLICLITYRSKYNIYLTRLLSLDILENEIQ